MPAEAAKARGSRAREGHKMSPLLLGETLTFQSYALEITNLWILKDSTDDSGGPANNLLRKHSVNGSQGDAKGKVAKFSIHCFRSRRRDKHVRTKPQESTEPKYKRLPMYVRSMNAFEKKLFSLCLLLSIFFFLLLLLSLHSCFPYIRFLSLFTTFCCRRSFPRKKGGNFRQAFRKLQFSKNPNLS